MASLNYWGGTEGAVLALILGARSSLGLHLLHRMGAVCGALCFCDCACPMFRDLTVRQHAIFLLNILFLFPFSPSCC